MCIQKIKVKPKEFDVKSPNFGKYRKFHLGVPTIREVSCGCCLECLHQRHQELELRMYAEYDYCIQVRKGEVYITSLTYDESHVPHGEFYGAEVKCFNHHDIQTYIKRLRHYISKKYPKDTYFKYFVVSEYGSLTKRPHYHILFFVDNCIAKNWNLFANQVRNNWTNGFTGSIYRKDFKVHSRNAFSYVSKYVQKTDDFCNYLRSAIPAVVNLSDKEIIKKFKEDSVTKKLLPYQVWSKNFGINLCERLTDDNFIKGSISLDLSTPKSNFIKDFPIPMYYKRKLLYDYDKETRLYRLNTHGVNIKFCNYFANQEEQITRFSDMLVSAYNLCASEDFSRSLPLLIQNIAEQDNLVVDTPTPKVAQELLTQLLQRRSTVELYNIYTYRHYVTSPVYHNGIAVTDLDISDPFLGHKILCLEQMPLVNMSDRKYRETCRTWHLQTNTIGSKYLYEVLVMDVIFSIYRKDKYQSLLEKYHHDENIRKLKKLTKQT